MFTLSTCPLSSGVERFTRICIKDVRHEKVASSILAGGTSPADSDVYVYFYFIHSLFDFV